MLEQEVDGIKYENPVGLSAGFDKEAKLPGILYHLSFGFMELGSITYHPYIGNPGTRLYRLKKSKAIMVNYGLKNLGVAKTIEKIKKIKLPKNFVFGVSVAKTNNEETNVLTVGIDDYYQSLKALNESNVGDYYTINVTCPNTIGGEPYTDPRKLEKLLKAISTLKIQKPVYIKMPINHPWKEFDNLLKVIIKYNCAGVVIGNVSKDRTASTIKDVIPDNIRGGISGRPTWKLSNELIKKTYQKYGNKLTIIGVGGIFSAEDAYTKIKLGASLVQLITGMIYEGPQLIHDINKGLVVLLKQDGYKHIKEAIGKGL
jgi:dihydroorotate dehydrogenase